MKKYLLYILIAILTSTNACTKDTNIAETKLAQKMIEEKDWFLDYSQTGTVIKNYIGQSTYFINFLKDGSTQDSDGLKGTYTIVKNNEVLQIQVKAKTSNNNSIEYFYDILSMGNENIILSYNISNEKTRLYFSNKK